MTITLDEQTAAWVRLHAARHDTSVSRIHLWGPQPIDREVLNGAMQIARRFGLSWWDSLVVSAAQVQSCPVPLSEDMQDGAALAGVTIRSPFTFPVSEAPAKRRAVAR